MPLTGDRARLLAAAVLVASGAVMVAVPELWDEAAPLRDRAMLAVWLVGAVASFILVVGVHPRRIPLRWLARPTVGPPLAAAAAVAVLASRWYGF